jgi:hypothetical protein
LLNPSPAGGCLLAMSCDYRVMVRNKFTIGLNETKLGIVAPYWFKVSRPQVNCVLLIIDPRFSLTRTLGIESPRIYTEPSLEQE